MKCRVASFLLTLVCVLPSVTLAQEVDNRELVNRLERMQRDLNLLQRYVYSKPNESAPEETIGEAGIPRVARNTATVSDSAVALARLEVKISKLEEKLRNLQGELERAAFERRQLQQTQTTNNKPTRNNIRVVPPFEATGNANSQVQTLDNVLDEVVNDTPKPSEQESTANAATEKPLTIPFQTPKEEPRILYNKAFQRLNQAQYVEAGKVFESFIKQFPKDPLIGNAYYWLGETYYVRGRYVEAADWFRQGFEILPDGPKANDNLLKLGISLHAQKKKSEACVILKELQKRTEKAGVGIKQKTLKEINRIGC